MRRAFITETLKKLLSTPEGRKQFAQSVTCFMSRPLRKLQPIDWSKVSFAGVHVSPEIPFKPVTPAGGSHGTRTRLPKAPGPPS